MVLIHLTEEVASRDDVNESINGFVRFEASIDSSKIDDHGNANIPFSDTAQLTVRFDDYEIEDENALKVEKTAGEIDQKNGTVTYTVTVSSRAGTQGPVTLNDVMSKLDLDGTVTISPQQGQVTETNTGFTVELPQMNPGDTYKLTYRLS